MMVMRREGVRECYVDNLLMVISLERTARLMDARQGGE